MTWLAVTVSLVACGDPFEPRYSLACESTSDCRAGSRCVDRQCVQIGIGGTDLGAGGVQSPVGGGGPGPGPMPDAGMPPVASPPDAGQGVDLDAGPAIDVGSPDAGPGLTVAQEAARIVIVADGSFDLVFAEEYFWQPSIFRDHELDATTNLAGIPGAGPKHEVLVAPVGILVGDWLTLNEASGGSASVTQPAPDEVVVETSFAFAGGGVVVNIATEYRVRSDRRIDVRVVATTPSPIVLSGYEFAYANLTPVHTWAVTVAPDGQSFRFAATGGAPELVFRTVAPTVAAGTSTDAVGNHYFVGAGGSTLSSGTPLELRWQLDF